MTRKDFKETNSSVDSLFVLIKSLSPAESRYLKIYLQRNQVKESSNYIIIFDAFAAYNSNEVKKIEERIRKKHPKIRIPETKYQLKKIIYKALLLLYGEKNPMIKLNMLKSQLYLSILKNLQSETPKQINYVKSVCEQTGNLPSIIDMIEVERSITNNNLTYPTYSQEITELHKQQNIAVKKIRNLLEYTQLYDQLMSLYLRDGIAVDVAHVASIKKMIAIPLLAHESQALSPYALYWFYEIYNLAGRMIRSAAILEQYCIKSLNFFDQNPALKQFHFIYYLNALEHAARVQIFIKNKAAADDYIKLIGNHFTSSTHIQLINHKSLFETYVETKAWYYLVFGEFQGGIEAIQDILKEIDSIFLKTGVLYQPDFKFVLGCLHLGSYNFRKAKKFFYDYINTNARQSRFDEQVTARLLLIFCLLELKEYDSISYTIRSVLRYINTKRRVMAIEKLVFSLAKRVVKCENEKQVVSSYKKALLDYKEIRSNNKENLVTDMFNFEAWIYAKTVNKNFKTVIMSQEY